MDRDKLLSDICVGVRLRPTVTVDKSKPVLIAEGEKSVAVNIDAVPPPPALPVFTALPPPPPSAPPLPNAGFAPKAPKLPPSFQVKMQKAPDREALMDEIKGGRRLRPVQTVDKSKPIITANDVSLDAPRAPASRSPPHSASVGFMGELSAKLAARPAFEPADQPEQQKPPIKPHLEHSINIEPVTWSKSYSEPVMPRGAPPPPPPPPPPAFIPNPLPARKAESNDFNRTIRHEYDKFSTPVGIKMPERDIFYLPNDSKTTNFESSKIKSQMSPTRGISDVESASESGFLSGEWDDSLSPASASPSTPSPEMYDVSVAKLQKQLSRDPAPAADRRYSDDVKDIAREKVSMTIKKFQGAAFVDAKPAPKRPSLDITGFSKKEQKPVKISPTEQRINRFEAPKRSGSISDIYVRYQKEESPEPSFRVPRRQGSIHDIVKKLEELGDSGGSTPTSDRPAYPTRKVRPGDAKRNAETLQGPAIRSASCRAYSQGYDSWMPTGRTVEERSKQFDIPDSKPPLPTTESLRSEREERVGRILRSNNPGQMIRTWRAPPNSRDVLSRPGMKEVTEHIEAKVAARDAPGRQSSENGFAVQTEDGRCMFDENFLGNMDAADLPKLYKMVICDSANGPTISYRRRAMVE